MVLAFDYNFQFPWELSNFISKPKINPTDLAQIERFASNILGLANQRLAYLQSNAVKYFGILNPAHKNLFILSSDISDTILETLFRKVSNQTFLTTRLRKY